MEELIMKEGFLKSENPNEYVKDKWTIRLDVELIEVFNDPILKPGLYFCGKIGRVDMTTLFESIRENTI